MMCLRSVSAIFPRSTSWPRSGLIPECVGSVSNSCLTSCVTLSSVEELSPLLSSGILPLNRPSRFEVVEMLVDCPRVNVNLRDKQGWSLLTRSIERNHLGEYLDCLASYFLPPTLQTSPRRSSLGRRDHTPGRPWQGSPSRF